VPEVFFLWGFLPDHLKYLQSKELLMKSTFTVNVRFEVLTVVNMKILLSEEGTRASWEPAVSMFRTEGIP
jgi:hypothetical protein